MSQFGGNPNPLPPGQTVQFYEQQLRLMVDVQGDRNAIQAMRNISREMKSVGRDFGGFNSLLNVSMSHLGLWGAQVAAAFGIASSIGLGAVIPELTEFNRNLLLIRPAALRYGQGLERIETTIKRVRAEFGLTRLESAKLYGQFQKGFTFAPIEKFNGLLKISRDTVGQNAESMQEFMTSIQAATKSIPSIYQILAKDMEGGKIQQLTASMTESIAMGLAATGKISVDQYKDITDKIFAAAIAAEGLNAADKRAVDAKKQQLEAISKMKSIIDDIKMTVATAFMPWLEKISNYLHDHKDTLIKTVGEAVKIAKFLGVAAAAGAAIGLVGRMPGLRAIGGLAMGQGRYLGGRIAEARPMQLASGVAARGGTFAGRTYNRIFGIPKWVADEQRMGRGMGRMPGVGGAISQALGGAVGGVVPVRVMNFSDLFTMGLGNQIAGNIAGAVPGAVATAGAGTVMPSAPVPLSMRQRVGFGIRSGLGAFRPSGGGVLMGAGAGFVGGALYDGLVGPSTSAGGDVGRMGVAAGLGFAEGGPIGAVVGTLVAGATEFYSIIKDARSEMDKVSSMGNKKADELISATTDPIKRQELELQKRLFLITQKGQKDQAGWFHQSVSFLKEMNVASAVGSAFGVEPPEWAKAATGGMLGYGLSVFDSAESDSKKNAADRADALAALQRFREQHAEELKAAQARQETEKKAEEERKRQLAQLSEIRNKNLANLAVMETIRHTLATQNELLQSQVSYLTAQAQALSLAGRPDQTLDVFEQRKNAIRSNIESTKTFITQMTALQQSVKMTSEQFDNLDGATKDIVLNQVAGEEVMPNLAPEQRKVLFEQIKSQGFDQIQAEIIAKNAQILQQQNELVQLSRQVAENYEPRIRLAQSEAEVVQSTVAILDTAAMGLSASISARYQVIESLQRVLGEIQSQESLAGEMMSRTAQEAEEYANRIREIQNELANPNVDAKHRAMLEGNLKSLADDANSVEGRRLALQTQLNELKNRELGVTRQIWEQTKVLRDGYVSAINAMNTGRGVFKKIIIDQNSNLGILMRQYKGVPMGVRSGQASDRLGGIGLKESSGFNAGGWYGPGESFDENQRKLMNYPVPNVINGVNATQTKTLIDMNNRRVQGYSPESQALTNTRGVIEGVMDRAFPASEFGKSLQIMKELPPQVGDAIASKVTPEMRIVVDSIRQGKEIDLSKIDPNQAMGVLDTAIAVTQEGAKTDKSYLAAYEQLSKLRSDMLENRKTPSVRVIDTRPVRVSIVEDLTPKIQLLQGQGDNNSPVTLLNSGGLSFSGYGKIPGRGPNKDSVPSILTKGEFVLKRDAVDHYGDAFLYALNNRSIPKNILQMGGYTGYVEGGKVGEPAIVPPYISDVSIEPDIDVDPVIGPITPEVNVQVGPPKTDNVQVGPPRPEEKEPPEVTAYREKLRQEDRDRASGKLPPLTPTQVIERQTAEAYYRDKARGKEVVERITKQTKELRTAEQARSREVYERITKQSEEARISREKSTRESIERIAQSNAPLMGPPAPKADPAEPLMGPPAPVVVQTKPVVKMPPAPDFVGPINIAPNDLVYSPETANELREINERIEFHRDREKELVQRLYQSNPSERRSIAAQRIANRKQMQVTMKERTRVQNNPGIIYSEYVEKTKPVIAPPAQIPTVEFDPSSVPQGMYAVSAPDGKIEFVPATEIAPAEQTAQVQPERQLHPQIADKIESLKMMKRTFDEGGPRELTPERYKLAETRRIDTTIERLKSLPQDEVSLRSLYFIKDLSDYAVNHKQDLQALRVKDPGQIEYYETKLKEISEIEERMTSIKRQIVGGAEPDDLKIMVNNLHEVSARNIGAVNAYERWIADWQPTKKMSFSHSWPANVDVETYQEQAERSQMTVPGMNPEIMKPLIAQQLAQQDRQKLIKKVEFKIAGGRIGEPDTEPAMLAPGEFVVQKDAVDHYGLEFMKQVNAGKPIKKFANGGFVQPGISFGADEFDSGANVLAGGTSAGTSGETTTKMAVSGGKSKVEVEVELSRSQMRDLRDDLVNDFTRVMKMVVDQASNRTLSDLNRGA